MSKIAKDYGVQVDYEVFLDRNYNDDYTLVSRGEANSMLENGIEMSRRYKMVVNKSKVKTISNNFIFFEINIILMELFVVIGL